MHAVLKKTIINSPQCLDQVEVSELVKLHKCQEDLDVKVVPAERGTSVIHERAHTHAHTQQIYTLKPENLPCQLSQAAQTPCFVGLIPADFTLHKSHVSPRRCFPGTTSGWHAAP